MILFKNIYDNYYHGTDNITLYTLLTNIKVNNGGGELGEGFYVGNFKHKAVQWAIHKQKQNNSQIKSNNVCVFQLKLHPFVTFVFQQLSFNRASKIKNDIKSNGTQRTHRLGLDFVYSPVVGVTYFGFYQIKYESQRIETYLNSSLVNKLIV